MKNEKIDVLNRREFVDRIIGLIESIAQSKEHRTFAIDGEWGSGKTWVLEEIEKELNEKEETPFLIIHYNCWEYDFYQEPLIAIVSALLDFVEKNKTLPSRTKGAVKKGLKKSNTSPTGKEYDWQIKERWEDYPAPNYDDVHTYCEVAFDDSGKTFYYRTRNPELKVGDEVYVPVGYKYQKKIGRIVSMEDFLGSEAPYPLERTKHIIGKV